MGRTGEWGSAQAWTGHAGRLYAVASGDLYVIEPWSGEYRKLGGGGWKPRFLGSVLGSLVSVEESGTLFLISPEDGSYAKASKDGEWTTTVSATTVRDVLYTRDQNGSLYAVRPRRGGYDKLPVEGTWRSRLLAGTGDGLFTRDNLLVTLEESGSLYTVDPTSGAYHQLPASWGTTRAMVGLGRRVLTADAGGALYAVDVRAGTYGQIGNLSTWKSRLLTTAQGKLYTLEEAGTIYEIEL